MEDRVIGRGGLKLEAAVQAFGLAGRLARRQAVDVGASTGGFTAVLLRHGVAAVTAVDVGHGQLHQELRADQRVTVLEKTDWKTLSLSVAPGPFDFFTVDVSFVAARSMLRGLAFRLTPGAEGVVLVKPQFEVAGHRVKRGDVSDPALRADALARFTRKAESLGFVVVAHQDSPVPGGEGTIEILTHLRFLGRSDRLPAPGERRPRPLAPSPRARGGPAKETLFDWFAVVAPGLEAAVATELAPLAPLSRTEAVAGGVTFRGPMEAGLVANLWSRMATRVLLRLGVVYAENFAQLRRQLATLAWREVIPPDRPLRVTATATRCRLYHTGALAETVALAIADRVGPLPAPPSGAVADDDEGGDESRVQIRGEGNSWTVSVDSSGALLHRRGYRVEIGRAPLRETLAAGLLALSGWQPGEMMIDPLCGAGTIVLEAAAWALDRAPGLGRGFAFERWPSLDPILWQGLLVTARSRLREGLPAPLYAFDQDPAVVQSARRNAERAGFLPGLSASLIIETARFGDRLPPEGTGVLILNPPYGRRLGNRGSAVQLARQIGRVLRLQYAGWRAGVLVADPGSKKALGTGFAAAAELRNGGLRVTLMRRG